VSLRPWGSRITISMLPNPASENKTSTLDNIHGDESQLVRPWGYFYKFKVIKFHKLVISQMQRCVMVQSAGHKAVILPFRVGMKFFQNFDLDKSRRVGYMYQKMGCTRCVLLAIKTLIPIFNHWTEIGSFILQEDTQTPNFKRMW
jgi:hypothetical protein